MTLQKKLNDAGFRHIRVINKDTVETLVDGGPEIFTSSCQLGQQQGSGLAFFGPVFGDHRMIEALAEDIKESFKIINQ